MKTTILAYVIALGGVAMIAFGLWGLYILIKERVAERRLMRDYIPTIQTIVVGFGLIGVTGFAAVARDYSLGRHHFEGTVMRTLHRQKFLTQGPARRAHK